MVRPKKHLGQHFLTDLNIAEKIASVLTGHGNYSEVLEVGPGTGVLTQFLLQSNFNIHAIEMDRESVPYLKEHFPSLEFNLIEGDFLKLKLDEITDGRLGIIGNFPYNISSQIFFKTLDNRDRIPELVGMIQKEVADRIAAGPGSKTYGILSVLVQAYYDVDYLFKVPPHVFNPPPKVDSAVIRLRRNETTEVECGYSVLKAVVKQAFNQRRKTLRNALKTLTFGTDPEEGVLQKRAEQLSVEDFVKLACCVDTTSHK